MVKKLTYPLKTIDDLVDHYRDYLVSCNSEKYLNNEAELFQYITSYHLGNVITVLLLDTNVTSKYDLVIINSMIKNIDYIISVNCENLYKQILDIYRDRK